MAVFRFSPRWFDIAETWNDEGVTIRDQWRVAMQLLEQRDQRLEAYLQLMLSSIDAWTNFTPTWTQSTTIACTVTYARYIKQGRSVTCEGALVATGAGTANNVMTVTLPVTAATSGLMVGVGRFYDSGVTNYPLLTEIATTTTLDFHDASATYTNAFGGSGGSSFSSAVSAGDTIFWSAVYEAAS